MKKILVIFIIAVLFSCTEDNTTVTRTKKEQLAFDIDRIKGYIEENNLSGFESLENGLHYKTLEFGNQKYPEIGDTLSVEYVGQLLNGREFDRNYTNQPFELILGSGEVIQGWELGLPYVDEEGQILLIIPSGLAYGNTSTNSIPENSILVFRIKLLVIKY